jgi:hypothetical protein
MLLARWSNVNIFYFAHLCTEVRRSGIEAFDGVAFVDKAEADRFGKDDHALTFPFGRLDYCLKNNTSSICFDSSVFEIFGPSTA